MNKVLEIDPSNMSATLERITREQLNHELRHSGLFFSVDPGANATLGNGIYQSIRHNIYSLWNHAENIQSLKWSLLMVNVLILTQKLRNQQRAMI